MHCEKNPGHEKFIAASDFLNNYLPRLRTGKQREGLRSMIDLTVRLRVQCTSCDRPDDDELSDHRGTQRIRIASGFIDLVSDPECNKPCSCHECDGRVIRKHWGVYVRTARHVVYNTEEAMKTKVDLFYDDESSKQDGMMKSVQASEIVMSDPNRDLCAMLCVSHDEDLVKRIKNAWRCWYANVDLHNPPDLFGLGLVPSSDRDFHPALIVSHPHGQPKKIAVGEVRYPDKEDYLVKYDTATCPGSSGAAFFVFDPNLKKFRYLWWVTAVHSGSYGNLSPEDKSQLNFVEKLHLRFGREAQKNVSDFEDEICNICPTYSSWM
ncbi:hypothetical protein ElyMa_002893600 [Elysia marginata]|uniref:Uncharacterized protein n=1 Tax=Elysia marginata TaxID=1093978 RepID=A0AAV4HZN2_9GAST|nr:hypothetical protein ElyMa_002893600 [Elysia marginata]